MNLLDLRRVVILFFIVLAGQAEAVIKVFPLTESMFFVSFWM